MKIVFNNFELRNTCVNYISYLQWVAGCISFLFPGLQSPLRSSYMPIHVYFGIATFIGAIASCLLGLNEKAIFTLKYIAIDLSKKLKKVTNNQI